MPNDRLIPAEGTASTVTSLLRVNGNEVPKTYQVMAMVVNKELNRIPNAKIIIIDGDTSKEDFPASSEDLFIPGKELEVLVGYEADDVVIFKGIIVKHGIKVRQNGQSLLKLDCRDKTFKSTLIPRNRYFTELTDSDAIEEVLGDYDFETDVTSTDITHSELVQFETTDWDFMISRTQANGQFCIIDDGKFSTQKPDFQQEAILTLTYGSTMLEFEGEIDARIQFSSISANSWDYSTQELLTVEATEPDIQEGGNLSASDLAEVSGASSLELRHSGQVIEGELQAWADATLLKTRLMKIGGRVKFQGFPGIKPGHLVDLKGVGTRFNGIVFVSGIRHEIANGTWNTYAQLGLTKDWFPSQAPSYLKPAAGLVTAIPGLQIGVVSQLGEDPEGENRILVKVPTISTEEEGIWARVATLDAGENRGSFFLPEIGDEVIVGFIFGDPRDPVILGMLNSSNKPAPLEANDDNFIKGFVTKTEMKFLFDDEKKAVSIETPAGKKIALDEDAGTLQLEDENGNKIIMDSSGIIIESGGDLQLKASKDIKMESGTNMELKAGANFKAEGSAGAEVSTSAVAILKGSLVQIN